jgi:hypothetical protein
MGLVALVIACGIAAQSPIFVNLGEQPDCHAPAVADVALGSAGSGKPVDRWATQVDAAAHRFGVQPQWVRAVMQAESDGIPSATSPAGAMGLMQIMPATWADLRRRYGLGADPYRPADNIMAGAAYMRELLDRYGSPDFLAAYNAGPGRLDDHLLTGRSLPDETQLFVASVAPLLLAGTSVRRPLAVKRSGQGEIRNSDEAPQMSMRRPAASAIFVQPTSISAATAVESVAPIGEPNMLDARLGEGLFVPLGGQRRIP